MPDEREVQTVRPLDFDISGWAETEEYRLRTGRFGFAVLEQRMIHSDGTSKWQRWPAWRRPIDIQIKAQRIGQS